MADAKITQLTALTSVDLADVVPIVDDPGGSPITKKITVANLLAAAWPIGSVFIAVVSTNPATLLGFGTWSAFGAGRTLVGLDSGDTDFDTVEETGGAKTHTLTSSEMPVHTHTQDAHSHTEVGITGSTGNFTGAVNDTSSGGTGGSPNSASMAVSTAAATATNQNTGSGSAHNNVQPYIVVYMWKRTS